jgi:hypothetical protein
MERFWVIVLGLKAKNPNKNYKKGNKNKNLEPKYVMLKCNACIFM